MEEPKEPMVSADKKLIYVDEFGDKHDYNNLNLIDGYLYTNDNVKIVKIVISD